MTNLHERIVIIGIGNEYRGDDAVGLYIARKLADSMPANCDVKESPGEGTQLLHLWEGYNRVILVDAVKSSSSPGTVHRVDAVKEDLPAQWTHQSSHTVSLPDAIDLARTIGAMPKSLLIFGIEGNSFEPGTDLSAKVREAADNLIPLLIAKANDPVHLTR